MASAELHRVWIENRLSAKKKKKAFGGYGEKDGGRKSEAWSMRDSEIE